MSVVEIYKNEIIPRIDYSKELADLEPVKKGEGRYDLRCPSCNTRRAYLYTNAGVIICNRGNDCQYRQPFLAYKNGGNHPEGQQYVDMVKQLAQDCDVPIEEQVYTQHTKTVKRQAIDQEILSTLWNYFIDSLPNTKGAEYIAGRNFPIDKKLFGMYPKVEELKRWITENKLDLQRCQDLGIIRHDFEGRLIGVWKAKDGDICNFWARSLDGKEPKYSRLANHSDLKQEYPQGSEHIHGDRSIWVEGHLDVVAAYLSAIDGVVGCGTATVPDKSLQALKTSEVILCLDNDQAGQDGMYSFIKKHRNDDLKVFVATIPHEDCKDLADVYEKHGEVAVRELFDQPCLIHGMTFLADYIIEKHRGEDWNDYSKTQAISELKDFSEKVSSENSWKLSEFFWPEVREGLDLPSEDIEALADSIEKKLQKEAITKLANKETKAVQEAFSNGDIEKGKEILKELNQEIQSQSVSANELQNLLKPSSEQDIINEMQEVSDSIYTGYDINDDVKIEFKGGAISVIAAPTSHGKTMALINFTLGALEEHSDKSVYFFTYEENRSAITTLFLNAYVGEELSRNNRGSIKHYFKNTGNDPFKYFFTNANIPISEEQDQPLHEYFLEKKDLFFKKLIESGRLNIIYCDHDASTLFELIRGIHEKRDDLGLICIDYMQLLNDSLDKGKRTSRQEELKSICLKMKDFAIDTGLPILISAQFNREVQSVQEMHATKIGEAGDIERISNLLLGLWNLKFKPNIKGKNNNNFIPEDAIYIEVLKGREIGVGHSVKLKYDGNIGRIFRRSDCEQEATESPKKTQFERDFQI